MVVPNVQVGGVSGLDICLLLTLLDLILPILYIQLVPSLVPDTTYDSLILTYLKYTRTV
jgi:hypothetical protein